MEHRATAEGVSDHVCLKNVVYSIITTTRNRLHNCAFRGKDADEVECPFQDKPKANPCVYLEPRSLTVARATILIPTCSGEAYHFTAKTSILSQCNADTLCSASISTCTYTYTVIDQLTIYASIDIERSPRVLILVVFMVGCYNIRWTNGHMLLCDVA